MLRETVFVDILATKFILLIVPTLFLKGAGKDIEMRKKMTSILGAVIASIFFVGQASAADVQMGAGAKFAWDNYKTAVLDYSTAQASGTPGIDAYSSIDYPSPRFGGNFQLSINRRIVLSAALDFAMFKHTVWPYPNGNANVEESTHKFFKLGVGVEGKFHLRHPKDKTATPYVFVGVGKYFAKNTTPAGEALTQTEMISKLASPFFVSFGFGAEYFVNESFSIGADIFGFRLEAVKADVGEGTADDSGFYTGEQSYVNFYMYSALTINFTFLKDKTAAPAENTWGAPASQNDGWGATGTGSAAGSWGTPAPAANSWGTPGAALTPAPANNIQPLPTPAPASSAASKGKGKAKAKAPKKKVGGSGGASVGAPPPPAP